MSTSNVGRRGAAMLLAAGGSLAVPDEPAAASHRTPVKQKAGTPCRTPPKQHRSSPPGAAPQPADAAGSPAPQAVALELQCYINMFEAMLTGRGLLKRRGERVTFQSLAPVVERSTGRAFKLKHLQQLKHIWPDAFQWQYIRAPALQDNTRLEYLLLLVFEGAGGAAAITAAADDSGAGRLHDAAARQEFKRRLCEWQQQQQHVQAACHAPSGEPARADQTSPAADTAPASLAALIPCMALPPKENAPRIGGSPTVSRGGSHAGMHSSPARGMQGSPAMSAQRGASLGPRMPPSPGVSGRPPPSPTTHATRGNSLAHRGRQASLGGAKGAAASILDVLVPAARMGSGAAGTPPGHKAEAASPAAKGTPTSRKRKAEASPQQHAEDAQLDGAAGRAEPRRRLLLDSSPSNKTASDVTAAAGGAASTPTRQHATGSTPCKLSSIMEVDGEVDLQDEPDLSPTMRARLGLSVGKPPRPPGAHATAADGGVAAPASATKLPLSNASARGGKLLSAFALAAADPGPATLAAGASAAAAAGTSPAASRQRRGSSAAGAASPAGTAAQAAGCMAASPAPSSASRPRNALLSRFMSEEALQELRRNSEAAPSAAAAAAEAARLHAASLLPAAMDLLRAIYGLKGPSVKSYDEVVALMRQKSSLVSGMSSEDARTCLGLITQHTPEYAQVEEQAGVRVLRISRTASVNAVRDRLKQVANTARAELTALPGA